MMVVRSTALADVGRVRPRYENRRMSYSLTHVGGLFSWRQFIHDGVTYGANCLSNEDDGCVEGGHMV